MACALTASVQRRLGGAVVQELPGRLNLREDQDGLVAALLVPHISRIRREAEDGALRLVGAVSNTEACRGPLLMLEYRVPIQPW